MGSSDTAQKLLELLRNPFADQLQETSVFIALGTSVGITAGIALAFSLLRPYNTVVYAPKLKHTDDKHAPPPLGKGVFAWVKPLWSTTEQDLVTLVGLDATIFIRFLRMCRNLFLATSVIGCGIIAPVNLAKSVFFKDNSWISKITPANVWADAQWAHVVAAYLMDMTVCSILWWNYRKVLALRRQYFESYEYQKSLHSRTLMLYDIPKKRASDEGIARIIDEVMPSSSFSRTAIGRQVKDLPALIQHHEKAVRRLEKHLAVYLKDPDNLPPARPLCLPSKKDRAFATYPKGQKLDAIEYWTHRIQDLETEIKEVRLSVDRRNSMRYGFASYSDMAEAHAIAYAFRNKKPHGGRVKLAPKPNDIIWENMALTVGTRRRRRLWNDFWIAVLTFLWVVPNAGIAIFLVNLSNLGSVWPAFDAALKKSPGFWSTVQAIASPALMSLFYLVLPIIFRRLSIRAGDQTKTGRERHVTAKLYSFFVFNNLFVFSLFGSLWAFVSNVIQDTSTGTDAWQAVLKEDFANTVFVALCSISPFWVTWLLQRQLSAAIDLAQLWTLIYSFCMRKFSAPTPRELIELTVPPPLDYASYYNYFLFYTTVALCYAQIQPLVLPAAALYFALDVGLRKYLVLYVFVTKNESGGMFWRTLFNRLVFATILANLIVMLIVWVRGIGTHIQSWAVAPLPLFLIAFKVYCARAFDSKMYYYSTRTAAPAQVERGVMNVKEQSQRNDRLAARFGHPALYRPLITPMVHAKAQNKLASVYRGRLTDGREFGCADGMSVSGYSDTFALDPMAAGKPGKSLGSARVPGFELVPEARMDFEYYKTRADFADNRGDPDIYGHNSDITSRPGTPVSVAGSDPSRPSTPTGGMGFAHTPHHRHSSSMASARHSTSGTPGPGTGYVSSTTPNPTPYADIRSSGSRLYSIGNATNSGVDLLHHAAAMPTMSPSPRLSPSLETPTIKAGRTSPLSDRSILPVGGYQRASSPAARAMGGFSGGPAGYGGLPQADQEEEVVQDPAQFDYFRSGSAARRSGRRSGGGWG